MKIWKRLQHAHVILDVPLKDKKAVFRFIAKSMARDRIVSKPEELYEAIWERESTMSTGIGDGFGLPHAIHGEIQEEMVFLLRLEKPIPFKSIDAKPVDVIIALLIPENLDNLHLRMLAAVSSLCRNPDFGKAVRSADDPERLWQTIRNIEETMASH